MTGVQTCALDLAGITGEGIIYGGELSSLAGRKAGAWWQLAGASYKDTVTQITGLLHKHIMPLFADFEDTNKNIKRILNSSLKGHALLYYIYYFGGKEPAERYFNKVIKEDKLKKKYISFYNSLKGGRRRRAAREVPPCLRRWCQRSRHWA